MKEFNISGEKTFITLDFIKDEDRELGALITLVKSEDINRVAREITGIDELLKNIRANVHEFKNKLHVILGLINIEEYEEAKKIVLEALKPMGEEYINTLIIFLISVVLAFKKINPILIICLSAILGIVCGYI